MTTSYYNFQNTIILFGAFQGFMLCFFLYNKKKGNPLAYLFFILFLFSLAYINFSYGLMFMKIYHIGKIPLSFPYPYDYLIATGFYFYVKSQITQKEKTPYYKKENYLFIPTIIYGLLQSYWYFIRIKEGDSRIIREVEASGFYTINEFVRFTFSLILGLLTINFLNRIKTNYKLSSKENKNIRWLTLFSWVFISYVLLSLVLTGITFLSDKLNINAFYFTFLTNTALIYWIGYIGYTKPNILFFKYSLDTQQNEKYYDLEKKIVQIMKVEEQFKNPNLSLSKLASLLEISSKELSGYINEVYKTNFSEYINTYKVEKVKTLLDNFEFKHYTLEAISREAGFNSKSSFNLIFKKQTGLTPSQYKKKKKQ